MLVYGHTPIEDVKEQEVEVKDQENDNLKDFSFTSSKLMSDKSALIIGKEKSLSNYEQVMLKAEQTKKRA